MSYRLLNCGLGGKGSERSRKVQLSSQKTMANAVQLFWRSGDYESDWWVTIVPSRLSKEKAETFERIVSHLLCMGFRMLDGHRHDPLHAI